MKQNSITEISKDPKKKNDFCLDCKNPKVDWASVNHGITLCLDCALNHKSTLGEISYIKSINMLTWNKEELNMMMIGGNSNFQDFLISYNINPNEKDLIKKYNNYAVDYYRKFLSSEIYGTPLNEKRPTLEDGKKVKIEDSHQDSSNNEPGIVNINEIRQDDQHTYGSKIDNSNNNTNSSGIPNLNNNYNNTYEGNKEEGFDTNHNNYEQYNQQHLNNDEDPFIKDMKDMFNEGVNLMVEVGQDIDSSLEKSGIKRKIYDNTAKTKEFVVTKSKEVGNYVSSEAPKWKDTVVTKSKEVGNYVSSEAPKWKDTVYTKYKEAYGGMKKYFGSSSEQTNQTKDNSVNCNIGNIENSNHK